MTLCENTETKIIIENTNSSDHQEAAPYLETSHFSQRVRRDSELWRRLKMQNFSEPMAQRLECSVAD